MLALFACDWSKSTGAQIPPALSSAPCKSEMFCCGRKKIRQGGFSDVINVSKGRRMRRALESVFASFDAMMKGGSAPLMMRVCCLLPAAMAVLLGESSCASADRVGSTGAQGDEIQALALALYEKYGARYGADTHLIELRLVRGKELPRRFRQRLEQKAPLEDEHWYWLVSISYRCNPERPVLGGGMDAVYDADTHDLLICERWK